MSAPIVLTAYKDDTAGGDTNGDGSASFPGAFNFPPSGDWRGIFFGAGSVSHLTHTSVRYGGQIFFNGFGYQRNPMIRNDGGTLFIDSTEMRQGAYTSEVFNQTDGDTAITDSHFTTGRVLVVDGGALSVHGSTFAQSSDALTNNSAVTVDATSNWWGDASGPTHTNNPDGTGSRIMGDVSFVPFLTADPTAATITLSDVTTPTTGNATTPLTFKVVYANSFNQAPGSVRLVAAGDNPDAPCQPTPIIGGISALFVSTAYAAEGDGCAMELDASASPTLRDGNFANGEQYILTQQFPAGNYAYHFEADGVRSPAVDEAALVITDGPAPCTVDCFSNVLFLPGIEGSRLDRPDYSGGTDQLWEPNANSDVTDLYLDRDGKSIRSDVYTNDVIDEKNVIPDPTGALQGNVYKSFLSEMKSWETTYHITATTSPYDWRLSLEDILSNGNNIGDRIYYSGDNSATATPYIIQQLRQLAASSKTGKVTIIAHSNGGLVAKALTNKLGLEASGLIDQIIFVAVPQVGTPQAIGALLHGYDQGLPFDSHPLILTPEVARQFASTSPMTYNLLPSASYFTYVDDSAVVFDSSPLLAPWRARYGENIHSAELLHTFITDQSRITLPVADKLLFPISGSETLLTAAEVLHNTKLDNWIPPTGVQLTEIAGWGEKTVKTVEYYQGYKTFCSDEHDINTCTDVPALTYGVKEVIDGDGTVLVPSALWTATSTGVKKYWVNLKKSNNSLPQSISHLDYKHADILEVPELRALIENIVIKTDAGLPNFISSLSPQDTDNDLRLRFTLHSPLSLDLYDNLGNHTGISTTTGFLEEKIPGSRYKTYGELKYVEAPASTTLRLVMNGYASGSFTLDIDKSIGDNIVASTTFAGVPSSTSTVATITIPQGGSITNASPLSVDENGDGTAEITLTSVLSNVVIPDLTPPHTTASTTGTLGANNWHTSNVIVRFSATDTGSGVKNTFYSQNGGAWNIYSTSSPLVISSEGSSTILYYSTDNAGNKEATNTLALKIDKTAPEASITFDPVTQLLKITGNDNLSSTTVVTTATSSLVTDGAGHTLRVLLTDLKPKTKLGRINMSVTALVYDRITTSLVSTTFKYKWATTTPTITYKTFAAFLTTKSTSTEAHFRPKKSQTIIMTTPVDLDDNDVDDACDARPIKLKLAGMVVPRMDTNKGTVSVNY